jgi:hypothetical protein
MNRIVQFIVYTFFFLCYTFSFGIAQTKIKTTFYRAYKIGNADSFTYRYSYHKIETVNDNKLVLLEEYFNDETETEPRRSIGKLYSNQGQSILDTMFILGQSELNKNFLYYNTSDQLIADSQVYIESKKWNLYKKYRQYYYNANQNIDSISHFLYRDAEIGLNEGFKKFSYSKDGVLQSILNNYQNKNEITYFVYKNSKLYSENTVHARSKKQLGYKNYNAKGDITEEKTLEGKYLYYEYTYSNNFWTSRVVNEEYGRKKNKLTVVGKEVREMLP